MEGERTPDANQWDPRKRAKEAEAAKADTKDTNEPTKYAGMLDKFREAVSKVGKAEPSGSGEAQPPAAR